MVHPIFSVLITKPELVMEHVAGYASLMREEASTVGVEVAKRAIAWGVTLFAFLVFLILAGVAAMLGAMLAQFHWISRRRGSPSPSRSAASWWRGSACPRRHSPS
jgi:hypothetical protein